MQSQQKHVTKRSSVLPSCTKSLGSSRVLETCIFRSVLFECVVGHQSANSGVNIAPGGARPSVPVSIQPWGDARALEEGSE